MRKAKPKKRVVLPDPVFGDVKVTKFVNNLMYDGKKSVAYTIFYTALKNVENKMKNEEKSPIEIWKKALDNIMPELEVKAVRRGGSNYQVPMPVREDRRQTLGLRWLITYSRSRSDRKMSERLAAEILDAVNGTGGAVKKKEDTHKMAEANKAFAHYRW